MTKSDAEVVWPKLKVANFCYIFITELSGHPATREITWQDFIPNEIKLNFDISKQNVIFPNTL
jgi:hypothetical protein